MPVKYPRNSDRTGENLYLGEDRNQKPLGNILDWLVRTDRNENISVSCRQQYIPVSRYCNKVISVVKLQKITPRNTRRPPHSPSPRRFEGALRLFDSSGKGATAKQDSYG